MKILKNYINKIKNSNNFEILKKLSCYFLSKIIPLALFFIIFLKSTKSFKNESNYFLSLEEQNENQEKEDDYLIKIFSFSFLLIFLLMVEIYFLKIKSLSKEKILINNNFFLNEKVIFFSNYTIKALSYLMLTISFKSLQRLIVFISFVTLNTIIDQKEEDSDKEWFIFPNFFSWKDKYLKLLFLFSLLISLIFPMISKIHIDFIEKFINEIKEVSKSKKDEETNKGLLEIFEWFKKTAIGEILYLIMKSSRQLLFWIVLLNYLKSSLEEIISKNNDFWKEVNSIEKREEDFKFFLNSQKIIRNNILNLEKDKEKKSFIFFCCNSFKIIPNFLKHYYLEKDNIFSEEFIEIIELTILFIDIVNEKIKNKKERNFIIYSLFNNFKSFEEFYKSLKKIKDYKNRYYKDVYLKIKNI
ncbi:MAG: hypothetical protein AD073_000169 [Mycoplasmataceae bacterium]|nr:MAG: hypothetical protein AD073_000169 [Mycoplasmataceae bacterium]